MTSYCFRNGVLVGTCRPTIRQAEEDAIRAGQAYRDHHRLVWRVPGEIIHCATDGELPSVAD